MIRKTLGVFVLLISITFLEHTFATNTIGWYWESPDQHYLCTDSLDLITRTSNVDPCGDLNSSSNVWEGFSDSSWDLDESSNGHQVYA